MGTCGSDARRSSACVQTVRKRASKTKWKVQTRVLHGGEKAWPFNVSDHEAGAEDVQDTQDTNKRNMPNDWCRGQPGHEKDTTTRYTGLRSEKKCMNPPRSLWRAHLTRHIFSCCTTLILNVTSTLAQVWRAAHISLHPIFMRSWCGCSDSLRFSVPLLAVPLLSYRLFHPLGLHLLLPWSGRQVSCALSLMRTLAPLPSTTSHRLWAQRPAHLRDHWTIHPGIFRWEQVPELAWPWVRWLHHRHSALFTTVHTGSRRCSEP